MKEYAVFNTSSEKLQQKFGGTKRKAKRQKEAEEAGYRIKSEVLTFLDQLQKLIQERQKQRAEADSSKALVSTKNKKKTKQQINHDNMVASLEAKYGKGKSNYSEPSEEDFLKARERIEKRKRT